MWGFCPHLKNKLAHCELLNGSKTADALAGALCQHRSRISLAKAIKSISKVEWSQVLHYMKATKIPYALLVNFGRLTLQYDAFDADAMASVFAAADEGDTDANPGRVLGGVGCAVEAQRAS